MDGVVSERMVSAGEYVKIGASLFKIVDANPLKLSFTCRKKTPVRSGQDKKSGSPPGSMRIKCLRRSLFYQSQDGSGKPGPLK